jgi:hypothetical protein
MPKRPVVSKNRTESNRREAILLLAGWLLLFGIHGLAVIHGFGEPDTARFAVLAEEWHTTGQIHSYSYHLRTSPLYLQGLKLLRDAGLPLRDMPAVVNWLNVIMGGLLLIPLYMLWRRLIRREAALLGCLLFSATPAFWLANVYGSPHLPAFALFVTSLWLLVGWVDNGGSLRSGRLAVTVVLAVTAVLLKADLLLCFGAYPGLWLCLRAMTRRNLVIGLALPAVSLVLVVLYARLISADMPALGKSAVEWSKTFPFTLEAVRDTYNRLVPIRSVGTFLYAGLMVSLAAGLVRRRQLRVLLFAFFWALPLLLFWGLMMGNSARHLMAGFCPLLFAGAAVTVEMLRDRRLRWAVVVVVLTANYFISPQGGAISPTANLYKLNRIVEDFAYFRHTFAKTFAELVDIDKKLYIGSTTAAYVEFESFIRADSYVILNAEPRIYRLVNDGNKAQIFRIHNLTGPATVGPSENYLLFTFEPEISIRQHVKWKAYLSDAEFKDMLKIIENEPR